MMHKVCIYLFGWLLVCGACTRDSGWDGRPAGKPGLNKVRLQMAVRGTSSFESYVHSLAVYAFLQTNDGSFAYYKKVADLTADDIRALDSYDPGIPGASDSKILKLTLPEGIYAFYYLANDLSGDFVEPAVGATGDFGYLPFPATGVRQAYFMTNVQVKPDTGTDVTLLVILDRVVCRLTVVLNDLPDTIDTVRYRVSGLASRLSLDEKVTGDTISVSGVYTRERTGVSATDTVIDRLMLFPALRSQAGLKLTFSSGSTVVREKQVMISGLISNNDVYISGHWESELTALARIFSNLSCSSPRLND